MMRRQPQRYMVKGTLDGEPFDRVVFHVSGRYAMKEVRRKYPTISLMTATPEKVG